MPTGKNMGSAMSEDGMTHTDALVELLKPCPFCGESARLESYETQVFVGCVDLDCQGGWCNKPHTTNAEAVASWNRRAALPSADALQEARKALEMARAEISGLVSQFDHQGCTCTFMSEECCAFARSDAELQRIDAVLAKLDDGVLAEGRKE